MKHKIPYILFLFSAFVTYGQVTLAVSDVKDPKVNQRFNLTVILEINGENMEQETPLRMPDLSKFDIIGTASEQNTIVLDSKKGEVLNQMVYQVVLNPKQAGKIKFGSVLVTVNGKIYKTEPFDIYVRENEKKSSVAENSNKNSEVHLNLEIEDKVVYKNEPAIAIVRAYSKDFGNLRKVSNIHFPASKNAKIKPINLTKSVIETNGDVASQIIGKYMIFPNATGNIEISPVSATLSNATQSKKISSNPTTLNVKKLPEGMPANYKNAVGNFDWSVAKQNEDQKPELELPVTIILKIYGRGNLGDFHLPHIVNSSDYVFFKPKITSKTSANSKNIAGEITAEYLVIPKKAGPISVQFENFCYFNPEEKSYVNLGTKSVELDVKTHEQIVNGKSTIEMVNEYTNNVLETVNTPVLQTHNLKIKDKSKINWNVVLSNLGIMAALLSLFFVIKKRKVKKKMTVKKVASPITSIAETEEIIRNNKNHHLGENINFLKILTKNKDFEHFFIAYQELNNDIKNYFSMADENSFRKFLEQHKGAKIADEYRILSEKIQIERFAPFYNDEEIEGLLETIITLYSEIIK